MLVLSRRKEEEIVVGHDVVIRVLEIRDGKVKLGITAPPAITVHRREVYEAIKRGEPQKPKVADAT